MSDKMNRRAEPPRSLDGKCPMCGSSRSVAAFDVMDKDSKYRRCEDCALLYVRDFMRPMGAGSVVRGNPRGVDREDALRVGVTFQWVTPESAARGDYEDAGWEREKEAMSFREAAEVVRNWLPYDSGSPQWNGRDALIFPGVQEHRDPKDGSVTTYDVIVEGDAVTLRRLEQWYHALVAGRTRLKPYRQNVRTASRGDIHIDIGSHNRSPGYRENAGAKMRAPIHDWQSAYGALKRATGLRQLGSGTSVRIGHNTTLRYKLGPSLNFTDDSIEVVLYSTPIVTYHQDGSLTLNSGGHQTVTTKARINEVTPPWIDVYQKGGSWFVREPGVAGAVPFHDGMRVKHRL